MRFLVDNALSPDLATRLQQAGHDALRMFERLDYIGQTMK